MSETFAGPAARGGSSRLGRGARPSARVVRRAARAGRGREPLVLADADVPHELLPRARASRTSSTSGGRRSVSAKQRAPHYLALLRERGYPDWIEQYSAHRARLDARGRRRAAPWGGLPPVRRFVTQRLDGRCALGIASAWERETRRAAFAFEKAVDRCVDRPLVGADRSTTGRTWSAPTRLDLMVEELAAARRVARAGRPGAGYDEARLERILALANEQQEWSRRTRDLLAAHVAGAARHRRQHPRRDDPAVAPRHGVGARRGPRVPRGGRGARRRRRRRVRGRARPADVDRPRALVQPRLLPALRRSATAPSSSGRCTSRSRPTATCATAAPPLRALAARFAAFTDFLGMPGWADPWYSKEARHTASTAPSTSSTAESRSPYFVTRALEEAGHPRARDRRGQRRRPRTGTRRRSSPRSSGSSRNDCERQQLGAEHRPAEHLGSPASSNALCAPAAPRARPQLEPADGAPGHLCGPCPKARCGFGSRSSRNGSGLVEDLRVAVRRRKHERDLLARARSVSPRISTSRVAVRAKPWFGA